MWFSGVVMMILLVAGVSVKTETRLDATVSFAQRAEKLSAQNFSRQILQHHLDARHIRISVYAIYLNTSVPEQWKQLGYKINLNALAFTVDKLQFLREEVQSSTLKQKQRLLIIVGLALQDADQLESIIQLFLSGQGHLQKRPNDSNKFSFQNQFQSHHLSHQGMRQFEKFYLQLQTKDLSGSNQLIYMLERLIYSEKMRIDLQIAAKQTIKILRHLQKQVVKIQGEIQACTHLTTRQKASLLKYARNIAHRLQSYIGILQQLLPSFTSFRSVNNKLIHLD